MSLGFTNLYERPPGGITNNYAPWDLTLRIRIVDDKGRIECQVIYHEGPRDIQGTVDDVVLASTKIQLDPIIEGCLMSWERVCGSAATANASRDIPDWNLTRQLTQTTRDVIQRGQALYRGLFGPGSDGSDAPERQRLRSYLADKRKLLRIIVLSNNLYIPWNVLYIDGRSAGTAPSFIDGFLGIRHQIVQQIRLPQPSNVQDFAGKNPVVLSQQCDTSLPIHDPMEKYVKALAGTSLQVIDRDHGAFTQAIQTGTCDDDILYFCCHGQRAERGMQARLVISQDRVLYPDNIGDLMLEQFFGYQPFVMINACFAGDLGETLFDAFGPAFLSRGASTILAPAVTVPKTYAPRFAKAVFEEIFKGENQAGEDHKTKIATLADAIGRVIRQAVAGNGELLALLYSTIIRVSVHMPHRITSTISEGDQNG